MVVNMLIINFVNTFNNMVLFMRLHALKRLNKMALLREKNRHVLETTRALLIGAHAPT